MPQEEDILETALNSGLQRASEKFGVPIEQVRDIVLKFKKDIDDDSKEWSCPCKDSKYTMMCFYCIPYKQVERINLK